MLAVLDRDIYPYLKMRTSLKAKGNCGESRQYSYLLAKCYVLGPAEQDRNSSIPDIKIPGTESEDMRESVKLDSNCHQEASSPTLVL